MTHDPSEAGIPPGQAIFLPAFQLPVTGNISDPRARAMFPGSKELNWFRPDNEHWKYCAGLYSLGQSSLDLDDPAEAMFTQRDRDRTLLIADSGGYQLGKNSFKQVKGRMSPEFLRDPEYDTIRQKVLTWMEAYADYGLIIDFPAWAIGKKNFIFTRYEDCLFETVRNMEFFRDRLTGHSPLKLLSVIQGRSIHEALAWYHRVKAVERFPYNGWSFAGPASGDPTITLMLILMLIKEGRLNETENWIHMLGKGSLNAIFVYNVFQECLDEFVNKGIRISYDMSSPFKLAKHGKMYTHMKSNDRGYAMQEMKWSKDIKSFRKIDRKKWCVWESPFDADLDNVGDVYRAGNKHGLDTKSYAFLGYRNVNIYCQAMNAITLQTKSLAEPENERQFPDLQVRFRRDVRSAFEKAASGQLSETDIVYLNLSQDYPELISRSS